MTVREEFKEYTIEELERKAENIWKQIKLSDKRREGFREMRNLELFRKESELSNQLFARVLDIEAAIAERR